VLDPKVTNQVVSTVSGLASAAASRANKAMRATSLSETDLTIIRSLADGMSNKQIGQRVHLSPHTIKDRLEKIFAILEVRSRTEVVAAALRRGLI
jgi:DNA-binding NarL/FixJ family response regulator